MGRHSQIACSRGHRGKFKEYSRTGNNGKVRKYRKCMTCQEFQDAQRKELRKIERQDVGLRANFDIHEFASDLIERRGILKRSVISIRDIVRQIDARRQTA